MATFLAIPVSDARMNGFTIRFTNKANAPLFTVKMGKHPTITISRTFALTAEQIGALVESITASVKSADSFYMTQQQTFLPQYPTFRRA